MNIYITTKTGKTGSRRIFTPALSTLIDQIYVEIAQVLINGANMYVPTHRKNFF